MCIYNAFYINPSKLSSGGKKMAEKEFRDKGEIIKAILEICNKIDADPKVREEAEEYQKEYGMLTEEELRRVIRI